MTCSVLVGLFIPIPTLPSKLLNVLPIELILSKKATSSTDPVEANATATFIELMRTADGIPVKHVKYPIFGAIENTMARRTYDESGDYTIKPFPIQVLDHQGATGTTTIQSSASSGATVTITVSGGAIATAVIAAGGTGGGDRGVAFVDCRG